MSSWNFFDLYNYNIFVVIPSGFYPNNWIIMPLTFDYFFVKNREN